jgi:drug/metabolite transporter (DMT)-like permease
MSRRSVDRPAATANYARRSAGPRMVYLLIALVLALTVYGQLVTKARALVYSGGPALSKVGYLAAMFTDFHVLAGLAAAVLASALWFLAIERASLSYAYPFMALTFALVPIGSKLLFSEVVSPLQCAGIVLIVLGVGLNAVAR